MILSILCLHKDLHATMEAPPEPWFNVVVDIGSRGFKGGSLCQCGRAAPARALLGMTATPRKDPCRAPGKTLAEGISRATTRPAPAKTLPPFACSCQPNQLGRHLCGNMQFPGQLSTPAWLHADLRGGSTTAPPQLLACLYGAACIASLGACRSEAEWRRMGQALFPSPIKLMDTYVAH